ncbi:MAG TPA: IPT/TIG domain-containing protein, partial [Gammaproteobacteria bacterium]
MDSRMRVLAAIFALGLFALLSGCGAGSSSSGDWFYHWDCNGDSECLATNPTGAASGTADEGPNESSCTELLTFGQHFWGIPPATQSCDQDANGSSGSAAAVAPTVSSISVTSGIPGQSITFSGTGFPTDASGITVILDGADCAVTSISATGFTCTLPNIENYTGTFDITTSGGIAMSPTFTLFNPLYAVAASGSTYVTVGLSGTILTSADAMNWDVQTSGLSTFLDGVAWNGSEFVTVGQGGKILTSATGTGWIAVTGSTTSQDLHAIAASATLFVTVGSGGIILTSTDGSTWTTRLSGTTQNLGSVMWNGTLFAVGGS